MNLVKTLAGAVCALLTVGAFAAVDINKASPAELESIKGIGPSMSTRIVDARKAGAFKDWSDLQVRVKGVRERNAARFSADGLTVNGAAFDAPAVASAKPAKGTKPDTKTGRAK